VAASEIVYFDPVMLTVSTRDGETNGVASVDEFAKLEADEWQVLPAAPGTMAVFVRFYDGDDEPDIWDEPVVGWRVKRQGTRAEPVFAGLIDEDAGYQSEYAAIYTDPNGPTTSFLFGGVLQEHACCHGSRAAFVELACESARACAEWARAQAAKAKARAEAQS
jgi:hypothetical protein